MRIEKIDSPLVRRGTLQRADGEIASDWLPDAVR